MRKFRLTKSIIIWFCIGLISLLISFVFYWKIGRTAQVQKSQYMAERWSEKKDSAQVSAFFSTNLSISYKQIIGFKNTIINKLTENSITVEDKPGARILADSYAFVKPTTVENDRGYVDVDAVCFGGDFFMFHPFELASGGFFSVDDINMDACVVDEDVAWQLFGSSDIAGQIVVVNDKMFLIQGVVKRPQDRLDIAAGLDTPLIFLPFDALVDEEEEKRSDVEGFQYYEIVMPSPIEGFAKDIFKNSLMLDETDVEIVQNTNRYSILKNLQRIKEFGLRSMNGKAIIYPFWENVARGVEDILGLYTFVMVLLLVFSAIVFATIIIICWRNRGWTFKDIWSKLCDRIQRYFEMKREKRLKQKEMFIVEEYEKQEEDFNEESI